LFPGRLVTRDRSFFFFCAVPFLGLIVLPSDFFFALPCLFFFSLFLIHFRSPNFFFSSFSSLDLLWSRIIFLSFFNREKELREAKETKKELGLCVSNFFNISHLNTLFFFSWPCFFSSWFFFLFLLTGIGALWFSLASFAFSVDH
jgi:hypothetical protein